MNTTHPNNENIDVAIIGSAACLAAFQQQYPAIPLPRKAILMARHFLAVYTNQTTLEVRKQLIQETETKSYMMPFSGDILNGTIDSMAFGSTIVIHSLAECSIPQDVLLYTMAETCKILADHLQIPISDMEKTVADEMFYSETELGEQLLKRTSN